MNIIVNEWETQFCAVTFFLDDGTPYIAFRGTDETIVGWKEDFNMSFLSPVPGQNYSLHYLTLVASKLRKPFYVGGHSKGGNFAIYASMKSTPEIQAQIIKIYSMDGPGFRPDLMKECNFDSISEKTIKILPHSSLIGMLFEKEIQYTVVASKTFGLAQHNPYTWLIENGSFYTVSNIYESRRFVDDTINEWILTLDEARLKLFIDTFYQVISASEAENLIELSADWKKCMNKMITALKEVDKETRNMLKEMIKSLFVLAKHRVKDKFISKKIVKKSIPIEENHE